MQFPVPPPSAFDKDFEVFKRSSTAFLKLTGELLEDKDTQFSDVLIGLGYSFGLMLEYAIRNGMIKQEAVPRVLKRIREMANKTATDIGWESKAGETLGDIMRENLDKEW